MNNSVDSQSSSKDAVVINSQSSYTAIQEILKRDRRLVYKGNGTSMLPMLRANQDIIVFAPKQDRLKKYDVALYGCGKYFIAHRVIKVQDSGYLIRGDNTYFMENVAEDAVIGVLTHFVREGKMYSVSHKGYQLYSRLWCFLYPIRFIMVKCFIIIKRVSKKLGITQLIKRLLNI